MDDLFLLLHRMPHKARALLSSLSERDISNQNIAYRKLAGAGFHAEAYKLLILNDANYRLLVLNLSEPNKN